MGTPINLPYRTLLTNAIAAAKDKRLQFQNPELISFFEGGSEPKCLYFAGKGPEGKGHCGCAIGVSIPQDVGQALDNAEGGFGTNFRTVVENMVILTDNVVGAVILQSKHDNYSREVGCAPGDGKEAVIASCSKDWISFCKTELAKLDKAVAA